MDQFLGLMKAQFVDKGIPLIIGEYGAQTRSTLTGDALQAARRAAPHLQYVTAKARALGLNPFYWDTGGLLDRANNKVLDQRSLDALLTGASKLHRRASAPPCCPVVGPGPAAPLALAQTADRPRVFILTDVENEPDDTQSLVRLMLYANELDLRGLVATTSVHMKDGVHPPPSAA